MTSKRQEAEKRWRDRVTQRLTAATSTKLRAQVWWDEFRRVADDKGLPAGERDEMYREAAEFFKAATQRKRR